MRRLLRFWLLVLEWLELVIASARDVFKAHALLFLAAVLRFVGRRWGSHNGLALFKARLDL